MLIASVLHAWGHVYTDHAFGLSQAERADLEWVLRPTSTTNLLTQMWVALDTTSIRASGLWLQQPQFDVLLRYLRDTGGRLVIADTAFKEFEQFARNNFSEKLKGIRATLDDSHWRAALGPLSPVPADALERLLDHWRGEVRARMGSQLLFAPVPPAELILPDVLDRAIQKEPPFRKPQGSSGDSVSDRGFKDAVIWLTALHYTRDASDGTSLAFVSSDGGFSLNGKLHPSLKAEGERYGVAVALFENIDAFVKQYAMDVAHAYPWMGNLVQDPRFRGVAQTYYKMRGHAASHSHLEPLGLYQIARGVPEFLRFELALDAAYVVESGEPMKVVLRLNVDGDMLMATEDRRLRGGRFTPGDVPEPGGLRRFRLGGPLFVKLVVSRSDIQVTQIGDWEPQDACFPCLLPQEHAK